MARPSPLVNSSSAVLAEHHQLTPRTPRSANGSRTSQLEEGFAKVRLTEVDEAHLDEDANTLQSAPLLASSSTARFSTNNARERRDSRTVKAGAKDQLSGSLWAAASLAPLSVGILVGGLLLFMLVLSLTQPEKLHRYLGLKTTLSSLGAASPSAQHASHHTDKSPLPPIEYLKVCAKMHEGYMHHGDYWDTDFDHGMGANMHHTMTNEPSMVCSKTITYMLDGTVGLAADLALMAQAAALARERNRTFLVDDTYWNRGEWTDHFEDIRNLQPGPQPGCKPPPGNGNRYSFLLARIANQKLPTKSSWLAHAQLDFSNRHWVITSRTAKFHFGHEFSNHYENPYAHELNRLKPIFMFALESFTSTILPTSANSALIKLARESFSSFLHNEDGRSTQFVSTHIRRGDRNTLSYSFPDRRVPIKNYIESIKSVGSRLHLSDALPAVYLATDSPSAHKEFVESYRGVVFSLFTAQDSRLRALASPSEYFQDRFNVLDLQTRITATRGMIVDLALLSGLWPGEEKLVPDAVVCALSSNICRLAPIGMGWDMAFGHPDKSGKIGEQRHRWNDVDEQGLIIPVWEAFELF